MVGAKLAALSACLAICTSMMATGAADAKSPCGKDHRIKPGETLESISAKCSISPDDLRRANPDVNWQFVKIGTRVRTEMDDRRASDAPSGPAAGQHPGGPNGPAAPGQPGPSNRPAQQAPDSHHSYKVHKGDKMDDVARALGVTVGALLGANPNLSDDDLREGREIYAQGPYEDRGPPPPPRADVSVDEREVEPGDVATIRIGRLPPHLPITVEASPQGSDRTIDGEGMTDRYGNAVVELDIPDRVRPGEGWDVQVFGPRNDLIGRSRFRIADRRGGWDNGRPDNRPLELTGVITNEGVECPSIRVQNGELFTLAGSLQGYRPGDIVTVTGRMIGRSTCQQGQTIAVDSIRDAHR